MTIITWLNNNSGFVMALLTLVYVIATILICIFNYKSAKATNEQTKESYKQFIENNRAHIVPKIIELEGEMLCLSFQNIGKDIATDVVINVNEKWLKKLEKTFTFPEVANSLRKIKKKKLFLTVDQQLCYGLCIPGNGHEDFKVLGEIPLKIDISYKTLENNYEEHYEIPLDGYNYMVNISDYARLTKKQIQEMKNTNKELKNISTTLKNKEKMQ
jgi:hypothetical protein